MHSLNKKILRSIHNPFHINGALQNFMGNPVKLLLKYHQKRLMAGLSLRLKMVTSCALTH